jgi:hypothetical protein
MQDLSDDDRKKVLSEVLMDELKAIREGIAGLPTRQEFTELRSDVSELKTDVKVVKAAVTDTNKQVADHETRLAALETAA